MEITYHLIVRDINMKIDYGRNIYLSRANMQKLIIINKLYY